MRGLTRAGRRSRRRPSRNAASANGSAPGRSAYSLVNSTAPLISATVHRPRPSGSRSTPTSDAPVARAAASASAQASGGGVACAALGTERDVRSPFARGGDAADRADHVVVGDDDAQIEAERAARAPGRAHRAPGTTARCGSSASKAASDSSSSHRSTPSPQLPNRGLTTTGGRSGDDGCVAGDQPRARVRQAGPPQQPGGEELVVRREQRRRAVEHRDARAPRALRAPRARRRRRRASAARRSGRSRSRPGRSVSSASAGVSEPPVGAVAADPHEGLVGERGSLSDDGDPHGATIQLLRGHASATPFTVT